MTTTAKVPDRVLIQRKASGGNVTIDAFESDIIRFYAGAEAMWIVFREYFDLAEKDMIRRVVLASQKNLEHVRRSPSSAKNVVARVRLYIAFTGRIAPTAAANLSRRRWMSTLISLRFLFRLR